MAQLLQEGDGFAELNYHANSRAKTALEKSCELARKDSSRQSLITSFFARPGGA